MTHQRNVEGLRMSAKRRHQQALQRAEEGIRQLQKQGRPVNFTTVAEVSAVSIPWLYQHPEVRQRIEHLREQQPSRSVSPPKEKASAASKEAMLATLRQRVKHLEAENWELKQQLEVVYGQLSLKQ